MTYLRDKWIFSVFQTFQGLEILNLQYLLLPSWKKTERFGEVPKPLQFLFEINLEQGSTYICFSLHYQSFHFSHSQFWQCCPSYFEQKKNFLSKIGMCAEWWVYSKISTHSHNVLTLIKILVQKLFSQLSCIVSPFLFKNFLQISRFFCLLWDCLEKKLNF